VKTANKDFIKECSEIQSEINRVEEIALPTIFGSFVLILYEEIKTENSYHITILKKAPGSKKIPPVRIHSECFTGDTLGSLRCDCRNQLHSALRYIEKEGCGAVIYLRQEGRGIGLKNKIISYKLQEKGLDTIEANEALGFKADLRNYAVAAKILKDIGFESIKLMTNNPKKIEEISKYGIKVVDRIPILGVPNPHNIRYLKTKKVKMGHLLPYL